MENYSVSWTEYQKNLCKGLSALQQQGEFVDMTLAAGGHYVKVHKMVLSLVSPFIKDLIASADCSHPVIFLNQVSYHTMQAILEYAYTGEVVVSKDKIGEFLIACKELHIKGLESMLEGARTTDCDNSIISKPNRRKRKKSSDEGVKDETSQVTEDDDIFETDTTLEAEVESSLPTDMENENDKVELKNHTENLLKKPVKLQYSVSIHGNMQVVLNRYLYSFIRLRKNNQRYWRCVNQQKTGCLAYVTTIDDQVKERGHPHNHAFHDIQIMKKVQNNNMYTSMTDVEDLAAQKKKKRDKCMTDLLSTSNE